ncbi:MAG: acyl--CoA ligase [Propionibacteriaceae bacterium]|nr:acyl--CoA ligase [Propionibacteriaceae bacterium]
MRSLLIRNATTVPDRLAVVGATGALTWRELDIRSNRLANALMSLGVGRGDRVAILWPNSAEWMVVWSACHKLGVAALPVNARLLPAEMAQLMRLAQATTLFCGDRFAEAADEVAAATDIKWCVSESGLAGSSAARTMSLEQLIAMGGRAEPPVSPDPDDESTVLFTSGTTGYSKAVVRTQAMTVGLALALAIENENASTPEVLVTAAPLYHTGGLVGVLKMCALAGTLVFAERLDPPVILSLIEQYQATQIMLLPPVAYCRLTKSQPGRQFKSVREVFISAGRCSMPLAHSIFDLFPNARLRFTYGSTEAASVTGITLGREELLADPRLIETVGRPIVPVEIRLVGEDGRDVAVGEVGEAWIRSPLAFHGYLGQTHTDAPADNPDCAVITDGWYHSGDLLRRDERGYYYVADRRQDLIKTGGENVFSQEVEQALLENPLVQACAVVGIPDRRFEEAVAAAVVPHPGAALTAADLVAWCQGNLAGYKRPRHWAIVAELPVNSVGKVQKNVLRENAKTYFTAM